MAAFQIPRTPHTTNKTIRFPDDVIADVEAAIAGKDCTFSAFVIAAVRSALAAAGRIAGGVNAPCARAPGVV